MGRFLKPQRRVTGILGGVEIAEARIKVVVDKELPYQRGSPRARVYGRPLR